MPTRTYDRRRRLGDASFFRRRRRGALQQHPAARWADATTPGEPDGFVAAPHVCNPVIIPAEKITADMTSSPTSSYHRRHFLTTPLTTPSPSLLSRCAARWQCRRHLTDPNLELHSAAASGNVGLVHYALTHGQPVNSLLHGCLPLHAASSGGNVSVVRMLIERGADVNAPRLPRRYSDFRRGSNAPAVGTAGECPDPNGVCLPASRPSHVSCLGSSFFGLITDHHSRRIHASAFCRCQRSRFRGGDSPRLRRRRR